MERDAAVAEFRSTVDGNRALAFSGNTEKLRHKVVSIHSGMGVGKSCLTRDVCQATGMVEVVCDFVAGSTIRGEDIALGAAATIAVRIAARLFCNDTIEGVRRRGAPEPATSLDVATVLDMWARGRERADVMVVLDE